MPGKDSMTNQDRSHKPEEKKCIIVPDTACAHECNQKYGDAYGVDWEYEGKTWLTHVRR